MRRLSMKYLFAGGLIPLGKHSAWGYSAWEKTRKAVVLSTLLSQLLLSHSYHSHIHAPMIHLLSAKIGDEFLVRFSFWIIVIVLIAISDAVASVIL